MKKSNYAGTVYIFSIVQTIFLTKLQQKVGVPTIGLQPFSTVPMNTHSNGGIPLPSTILYTNIYIQIIFYGVKFMLYIRKS